MMQPIITDASGVKRFKANRIVRYLLDRGGLNLNDLACAEFTDEDREQFAQLIGYSLSGYSELGYVSDASVAAAEGVANEGLSEDQARIAFLEHELGSAREGVRIAALALFRLHPDDMRPR